MIGSGISVFDSGMVPAFIDANACITQEVSVKPTSSKKDRLSQLTKEELEIEKLNLECEKIKLGSNKELEIKLINLECEKIKLETKQIVSGIVFTKQIVRMWTFGCVAYLITWLFGF